MALPAPDLDDRDFQSLVDDAKRLVQRSMPEWTDHNVSDPGVTLIEAFAQMMDQLIYRLNRVPDRHYAKFLELVGLRLFPAVAARGTATFWLSAPQPTEVLVRAETEVATARTDLDEPITFSTTAPLSIVPCHLTHLVTAGTNGEPIDHGTALLQGTEIQAFFDPPIPGDTLLIGLSAAVPSCSVLLRIDCPVGGIGIDPRDPPLAWEAWDGHDWVGCEVGLDETGGLNRPGDVILHVPATHQQSLVVDHRAGWLRCRVLPVDIRRRSYSESPRIRSLQAMTVAGTVEIIHAETVAGETIGTSDGTPGQRFALTRTPVIGRIGSGMSVLEVSPPDLASGVWTAVDDFAGSGPTDPHFRLDEGAGEVEFGPAVRQSDGTIRQYGAVPPARATLVLSAYRVGGGRSGNLARGQVRVLKTSVPYVTGVQNRHPTLGGVDGETMPNARKRGPLELKAGGRAVTAGDFEVLARQVAPDAGRIACLPATELDAGVKLLVVPPVLTDYLGRTEWTDLTEPPAELLRRIRDHLETRRVIGTRLLVQPPVYRGVTVVARVVATPGTRPDALQEAALQALYAYLSPDLGGKDRTGWPFGHAVQAFDVSTALAAVPGVATVQEVLLFPADVDGNRSAASPQIQLEPGELVYSYQHQVLVQLTAAE